VLKAFADVAALIECRLGTGRTHQIRVHLTERGHPVIGDPVYGSARSARRLGALTAEQRMRLGAFPRQALHAHLLGFVHPVSGELLEFRSNLPNDITDLLAVLD
jgi:23S rRNA pseudouridine1911/1915/1917 synthase